VINAEPKRISLLRGDATNQLNRDIVQGQVVVRTEAGIILLGFKSVNTFPALKDGDFRRLEGGVPPRPQNV
jgi:hypothetical protein